MRIISKFKDYYDGAAAYGVDTERVYVRERSTVKCPVRVDLRRYDVLGFCGEIYVISDASVKTSFGDNWVRHPKEHVIYGVDNENWWWKDTDPKNWRHTRPNLMTNPIMVRIRDGWDKKGAVSSIEEIMAKRDELKKIFLYYRVPVFKITIIDGATTLELNPRLKDLAFYKMRTPVQAFQDISMFVSNQLTIDSSMKMPVGSDDDIRDSKGFDKHSFRKEKS